MVEEGEGERREGGAGLDCAAQLKKSAQLPIGVETHTYILVSQNYV